MSDVPATIGRYAVERLLGEGGMGVLYLARDPVLDRYVALKLLRVNGEDLRRRFIREAQSAGRLQHPNIVTVYDVGDHDGELYIAMEYIDGDTLATLIRDDAPFSAIRKLDIIDEVADGLGFAHQRGIIHRDIKPANLMISRAGLVKVLDFGIARLSSKDSGAMETAALIGTPAYMAPEQLDGVEADARTDIYAVGVVMYELLSGCRAFAGATTAEVLQRVMAARPTPIEQLVPNIHPDLASVVTRAMARRPEDRYQDLQAMRKDLARARRRAMPVTADDATIVVTLPAAAGRQVTPPPTVAPTPTPGAGPLQSHAPEAQALQYLQAGPSLPPPTPPTPTPSVGGERHEKTAPVTQGTVSPGPTSTPLPPPLPPPPPLSTGSGVVTNSRSLADPADSVTGGVHQSRAGIEVPAGVSGPERTPLPATVPPPQPTATRPAPPPPAPPVARPAAAPPPLASPGMVSTPGMPAATPVTTRKGISPAVLITVAVAFLAFTAVAAFLVVRMLGAGSMSGLFTRTIEPKVSGTTAAVPVSHGSTGVDATQPPPADPAPSPAPTPVPSPATEVALDTPPVAPAPEPPTTPAPEPSPAPKAPAAVRTQPAPQQPPTPRATVPPARQARPATTAPQPAQESRASVTPPPAPRVDDAPRVVERVPERREPEPPPVAVAPRAEAVALVRTYVAARNTAHAAGIRRVWPTVDDVHLRRITSAFSAPLTLGDCDVEARDAQHAVATCRLTQAGTTGPYASGQALTIRRTFVFELQRDGGVWVISGLRE